MKRHPVHGSEGLSRRTFLERSGALLGGSLLTRAMNANAAEGRILISSRPDAPYELARPENCLYSVCLNCNTGCGIKVKIQNGVVTKIDGNPYNPWTLFPHLPGSASPFDAVYVDGSICPKGQAGLQTAYDPYRIRKVLKRAGKRGENRWITIDFDQAIREIVEGGKLFAHVPGEENREVEGLRSLLALRDPKVAAAMASDIAALWKEKDPRNKAELVARFKQKYAAHLNALIDPDHPDLGPHNNQFVIAWGRLKGGRAEFIKRFGSAFGTLNLHGHTTVCQGSLYFTCKAMSEQYRNGGFGGGQKFYFQADTENADFILFVGANLFEANYGPPNRSVRLTENIVQGRTRIAVVDPRFSKLASKAWKWLPIKPGTDGALAMAFLRWLFEHEAYDARFLSAANKAAATAAGETTWTDATWLVEIHDGRPGAFARAADHGLARPEKRTVQTGKGPTEYEEKFLLVRQGDRFVPFDPNDVSQPVVGDLFVDAALPDGTRVKSALQIIREEAFKHSFEEWCAICELAPHDVEAVVAELARHGKRAAVDLHRGVAQHTNGFYNVLAWYTVNALLGNFDWQGGMSALKTYPYDGSEGGPYNLTYTPGAIPTFGISIIRHGVAYEETTLFEGYPARRNWYPLSSDIYEEIIPSIGDAYPYPVKVLLMYMGAPTYALPAGHTNIEILQDVNKLPLFIASDILIGPTSMYADYIFPDLSYLERWEFHGSHPNINLSVQPVRQPVMSPVPETCRVYGQEMPICLESLLMALAEKLALPAFGPDALGPGEPLTHYDHFYLKAVANLAAGTRPDGSEAVPDADARELELFLTARRHLPRCVFDPDRWRAAAGDRWWAKVVHVLNRGGRFQDAAAMKKAAPRLPNPYGKLLCLYQEKTAKYRHSGTGQPYIAHAAYVPLADYQGRPLDGLRQGYDLHLITHRVINATKSRTISNYWLHPLMPENTVLINPRDAHRLGLRDGDAVKVVSATNPDGVWPVAPGLRKPMIGRVQLTETIRPGVISFALGWGHWATGAADVVIDGHRVPGDPRRATGIHANAAMWTDPALKNTCLLDPVGGSVSFYDTVVRLEKMPPGTLPPLRGRLLREAHA
jgi:anaerobic selenocysteine-containing dehydrogenase